MIQTAPSPLRGRNAAHSFWDKLRSLSGTSHQLPRRCFQAGNFQKFLKLNSQFYFKFSLIIPNPKSTSWGKTPAAWTEPGSVFCIPTSLPMSHTHSNSRKAARSGLLEWVLSPRRGFTQCTTRAFQHLHASRIYSPVVLEGSKHIKWLNKDSTSEKNRIK